MNFTETTYFDYTHLKDDDLNFITKVYGNIIYEYLETRNVSIAFFAGSEHYADEISSATEGFIEIEKLEGEIFTYSITQDFSFEQKQLLKDVNFCKIKDKKFLKIITPFTRPRSYDFIIAKAEEIDEIVSHLTEARNKTFIKRIPPHVIGIPIEKIQRKTIDFLLDEDLRNFCIARDIPLKRGVVFEGLPGNGKSMTLKFLRAKAENSNIEFEVFNDVKEFLEGYSDFYGDEKKIFVFEDFDTVLIDRENTGDAPNQVLGKILNILDGVKEIDNVVSIFTTNKVKIFDDAFMRPGRIDTVFTFDLPTEENIKEFVNKYLFDFNTEEIYSLILKHRSNVNVSFAFLKGISDDINIFTYLEGHKPDKDEIEDIIKEKIYQFQKGENKDTKDFIL